MEITRPQIPTLVAEEGLTFYKLPPGKIDKESRWVIQKGQKGQTCTFYAIKRLLTPQQLRTPHGRVCSAWRKAISTGEPDGSKPEFLQDRKRAHITYFGAYQLDPDAEAHHFWKRLLQAGLADIPEQYQTDEQIEGLMRIQGPQIAKTCPNFRDMHLENAQAAHMAKHFGLRTLSVYQLDTYESLNASLLAYGPLIVLGDYGSAYRSGKEPMRMKQRVHGHNLFRWLASAKASAAPLSHTIIVVGTKWTKKQKLVYWVDPKDPSDPSRVSTTRVYGQTFAVFSKARKSIYGVNLKGIPFQQARQATPGAFYNPLFARSRTDEEESKR